MFEHIMLTGILVRNEEDYEKLLTLSYIDDVKKTVMNFSKDNVVGCIVVIESELLLFRIISDKAKEAMQKGLIVTLSKAA